MKKIIILLILIILTIGIVSSTMSKFLKGLKNKASDYIPNDMIFMPGNSEIESFYIGSSEETNYNWQIYLIWLEKVYIDYKNMYSKAIPKSFSQNEFLKYNDKYIDDYFDNPAFANYPVTGVSWLQVQDYLLWKTDRINEYILIQEKLLYPNPQQAGDENFNTEAFLARQYLGLVKNVIKSEDPFNEIRQVNWNDRILLPAFRLPTEAEWDYASDMSRTQYDKSHKYKYNNLPFGKDYFLSLWIKDDFAKVWSTDYYNEVTNVHINASEFDFMAPINSDDFKNKKIVNMNDNVSEWTAEDYYDKKSIETNWFKVYIDNGFEEDFVMRDVEGVIFEKDFKTGRMHYRIFGSKLSGDPLYLQVPTNNNKKLIKGGDWTNPNIDGRYYLPANQSSFNVGFRSAMTYIYY